MGIIRKIMGFFVTLKNPGIQKILDELETADQAYHTAIEAGALTREDKVRVAAADDAEALLIKYVDDRKIVDGKPNPDYGKVTTKFETDLMPFMNREELAASIRTALGADHGGGWANFEVARSKVIAYAQSRKAKQLFGNKDQTLPRPWEGLPCEGALNWAWGPMLDVLAADGDADDVNETTKLRVDAVHSGLRDLELVRTGAAVTGLRKILVEARKLRDELANEKAAAALFDEIESLKGDLKRSGAGGAPNSIDRAVDNVCRRLDDLTAKLDAILPNATRRAHNKPQADA